MINVIFYAFRYGLLGVDGTHSINQVWKGKGNKMVVSLTSSLPVDGFTAGQVGVTALTGILIVFAVLAVIFIAMMIMQSIFTRKSKPASACSVVAPFDATVDYLVASNGAVKANEVVMVVSGASGKSEVLAPDAGELELSVQKGSSVKKGDALFTID